MSLLKNMSASVLIVSVIINRNRLGKKLIHNLKQLVRLMMIFLLNRKLIIHVCGLFPMNNQHMLFRFSVRKQKIDF